MKIILFTDIHGKTLFIKSLSEEIKTADLVVVCGDITHFGNAVSAKGVLDSFSRYNNRIIAVAGNCDLPEVETLFNSDEVSTINGINFVCLGGSLITPSRTPNEHYESYYEQKLANFEQKLSGSKVPLILVSHQPPFGTINDKLSNGLNIGSKAVRRFIEKYKPLFCLTGHIHEGRGCDYIGMTKVINPGPFSEGFYASIQINQNPLEAKYQIKQAFLQ